MSCELIEQTINESTGLRCKAQFLLARLLALREESMQRLAERGSTDPLARITGRSAYDNAIDSTRQIIRRLDDVEHQHAREHRINGSNGAATNGVQHEHLNGALHVAAGNGYV